MSKKRWIDNDSCWIVIWTATSRFLQTTPTKTECEEIQQVLKPTDGKLAEATTSSPESASS
uniref:Uncharacterized protein n=1 Tax=Arion vulgaris TaxID=1028688 RepID=A0A0B7AC49_9EUPU